jgi:tetratricopeptide (TPR) repeat protein
VAYRQGYFALVKTLVRFERAELILDGTTIPVYDRPEQNAWRNWALGLAHVLRGELEPARQSLGQLERNVAEAKASRGALGVAVLELEGQVAVRAGETKKGWALLRKAAAKEKALIYTEPPDYPRPVVEAMGSLALHVGDFVTAERAYTEALATEPGSGRACFGLAAALAGLERPEEAQARLEQAERAWDKADPDLPQMQRLRSEKLASAR